MATSSTTTTTPAAAKPNPTYFQSAPVSQETIEQKEVLLHLYAYQHYREYTNGNQRVIVDAKHPKDFGTLVVNDWTIYDSLLADDSNASIVARAQGLYHGADMAAANYFICFNMVFVDERFTGSSFMVMGVLKGDEGEWAIVGGTGEFAYAQGVITYKKTKLATGNLRELYVSASVRSLLSVTPPVHLVSGGLGGLEPLHTEVRIRCFLLYRPFGGTSSTDSGRVESCVWRISREWTGVRQRFCLITRDEYVVDHRG
uniref:Uncharacterized protein n=1 Tax=Avena sativa TaxID=4498 RepID=A0ACD5V2S7_AVESA